MSQPSSALIAYIYKMAGAYQDDASSDGELLTRYAKLRDERAFSTLMVRHGATVWNVCRRVLANTQDVEEAYQSTFLALAQRAKKVNSATLVPWLHQVAHRAAITALRKAKSRLNLHKRLATLVEGDAPSEAKQDQAHEALHEELAGLPEKLRVAVVLHYLEGKTEVEVARILGLSKTATWSRITRGRTLLHKRLAQKGFILGTIALTALMKKAACHAIMPSGLLSKTLKAATAFHVGQLGGGLGDLTMEVLKHASSTVPWWKKAWMITLFCISGLAAGTGGIAWRAWLFRTEAEGLPGVHMSVSQPADRKERSTPRLDLYGDPLPPGGLARLGTMRLRHNPFGRVDSLQFTPDGKGLLTAGANNPPRLWDVETGKLLQQFGSLPPENVLEAILSSDGKFLACRQGCREGGARADGAGNLYVWEAATGRLVREFLGTSSDQYALNCGFFLHGNLIAAQLEDHLGVWEIATGRRLWRQPAQNMRSLVISPDGRKMALVNPNNTGVMLLDALTGKKMREVASKSCPVRIAFSADSRELLIECHGTALCTISLWKAQSDGKRCEISNQELTSSTLSPDGKHIAGRSGGILQIWDVGTGKVSRRFPHWDNGLAPLAYSPNGGILASVSRGLVHFWDVRSGKKLAMGRGPGHSEKVTCAAFLSDGETLATGAADGTIRVWDTHTGVERQAILNNASSPSCVSPHIWGVHCTLSPDGSTLAANFGSEGTSGPEDQADVFERLREERAKIRLWNVNTGRELRPIQTPGAPSRLIWSPDGKTLAGSFFVPSGAGLAANMVFVDRTVMFWRPATGKKLERQLRGEPQRFARSSGSIPTFLLEGRVVATINPGDKSETPEFYVNFWEVKTGFKVGRVNIGARPALGPYPLFLAISLDGRFLAVQMGRKLILWSLHWDYSPTRIRTGIPREIAGLPFDDPGIFVFSDDARLLAYGGTDGIVRLIEISSGRERAKFTGHLGLITTLCFSSDCRRLVSGSDDSTLLVWDVTGGAQSCDPNKPIRRSKSEFENLWMELGHNDPARAGKALWELVASGQLALGMAHKYLDTSKTVPRISAQVIERHIANLDDAAFEIRKRAKDALTKLTIYCEPTLRLALKDAKSAEKRRLLEELLFDMETKRDSPPNPILVHRLRAMEVVERIGTAESRRIIQNIATSGKQAALTEAAKAALRRIDDAQFRRARHTQVAKRFDS